MMQLKRKKIALLLAACLMLVILDCSVFYVVDMTAHHIALRHVAAKLGTIPERPAIMDHVKDLLQTKMGCSSAEVHELLDSIGSFEYTGLDEYWDGRTQESAYWTLGQIFGMPIWGVYILRYDSEGKLYDVSIGESW
jgi:hypothetical protein